MTLRALGHEDPAHVQVVPWRNRHPLGLFCVESKRVETILCGAKVLLMQSLELEKDQTLVLPQRRLRLHTLCYTPATCSQYMNH